MGLYLGNTNVHGHMNLYQFMLVYQDVFNPKYFLLFSIILTVLYDWKIQQSLHGYQLLEGL